MRLLFDQNLSPRLVGILDDLYPESIHVRDVGLQSASDQEIWEYAIQNGLTIVSKDSDFHQRSFVYGHPPKVVWVRRGNCTTSVIASILREYQTDAIKFEGNAQDSFLALG